MVFRPWFLWMIAYKVNIEQRLEDIENRYGKNSDTYILAKKISIKLKGE